jgi:putative salt-induced outer membrane protein YdiY
MTNYNKQNTILSLFLVLLFMPIIGQADMTAKIVDKPLNGSIKLGGNVNRGNSEDTNLNGEFNLRYEKGNWLDELNAKAQYNTGSKGVNTDRSSLAGNVQYGLNPQQLSYLFANVTANRDRFDPYDFVLKEVIGYGKRVVNEPNFTIKIATGPGARHSRITATQATRNEFIWQANGKMVWNINPQVDFKQELLNDFGAQNNYSQSVSALTAKLTKHLAFEAALTIQRNSNIPPESTNTKKVDTNTTFSLVYSF